MPRETSLALLKAWGDRQGKIAAHVVKCADFYYTRIVRLQRLYQSIARIFVLTMKLTPLHPSKAAQQYLEPQLLPSKTPKALHKKQ